MSSSSGNSPPSSVELRVATLNCWALPGPWPIGSRDRRWRLEKLAEQLLKEQYDVVGLQELWSEYDYMDLAARVGTAYPFSHYFHSGFTGSGVSVLSRHPIVSTLMHRYSLNGFAHHIHRGDWFGGKVVGMVELEIGEMRIHFYATHLHAEYNRMNDLYLPHRLSQAFELSQFIRHTSRGADMVIVTGDFNMEPDDLGYRMILSNARLFDAWRFMHGNDLSQSTLANGMTCNRPDNCYTLPTLLEKLGDGKRLDYILYKNGRMSAELVQCETCFNHIPGEDKNYSDHIGVYARFSIEQSDRQMSCTFEHNRPLIKDAMKVIDDGEGRAIFDRKLFIGAFIVLLILIISSIFIDYYLPYLAGALMIMRFILTLVVAFCVWYGFLGLTMELKALKGTKQSMGQLLNE